MESLNRNTIFKSIPLLFFLFLGPEISAQIDIPKVQHYDTLFYKSGMKRACTILTVKYPEIHFVATNAKGKEMNSTVSFNALKFYKDYDSLGLKLLNPVLEGEKNSLKSSKEKPREDSLWVTKHNLSINPFSPFFLGLNVDYNYRFGHEMRLAIHVPFRIFTWYGAGILFNSGIGLNYIPFENEKSLMSVGLTPQFYIVQDAAFVGFPVCLGLMSHLTERMTFNGYIGVGPKTTNGLNFPVIFDAHVGIGFKLGKKYLINTKTRPAN